MPSPYILKSFNFETWRGPAPHQQINHGRAFTKPGAAGVGLQRGAIHASQFEVILESWWATYTEADQINTQYSALPYSDDGPHTLIWNHVDYSAAPHQLKFHVLGFEPLRVTAHPSLRRTGVDGFLYTPGARNVSRWILQPVIYTPPPP